MIHKSIATCKLEDFKKKIDFLNKRLRKMNKPELTFVEGERFIKKVEFHYHEIGDAFRNDIIESHDVEFVEITVEGLEFFKKDDCEYNYIGSINYEKGIKTVYCIDDEKYLKHFQEDSNLCDHCHTRRHRNSYVLFEGNGKVIRVGSNCCRDFFGYDVSNSINCYLRTMFLLGEPDSDWELLKASEAHDFHLMYKLVKHCTNGFTNWKKSAYDSEDECYSSTTGDIRYELEHLKKDSEIFEITVPEGAYEKVVSYWENQKEDSTFVMNMKESIKQDYCIPKNIGSYAYAIYRAMREEAKKIEAELLAKTLNDSPYKDGERPEITGVVTYVTSYESDYGYNYYRDEPEYVYCIEFMSDDNVLYYMSTSSRGMEDILVKDRITVKGTVSGRKDYKAKKRWVLKRPKLIKHEKLNDAWKEDY